jgi:hypothetical protein
LVGKFLGNHFQRFLVLNPAAGTEIRQEVAERRSIVNRLSAALVVQFGGARLLTSQTGHSQA